MDCFFKIVLNVLILLIYYHIIALQQNTKGWFVCFDPIKQLLQGLTEAIREHCSSVIKASLFSPTSDYDQII